MIGDPVPQAPHLQYATPTVAYICNNFDFKQQKAILEQLTKDLVSFWKDALAQQKQDIEIRQCNAKELATIIEYYQKIND